LRIAALLAAFLVVSCGSDESTGPTEPDNAPVISSITPTMGEIGTEVTITGRRFSPIPDSNHVAVGLMSATVLSASDTQLVVTVPPGATTGNVVVQVGKVTGESSEEFRVFWKPVEYAAGSLAIADICWTGKRFVAVGGSGVILTSPNGTDWSVGYSGLHTNLLSVTGRTETETGEETIVAVGDQATVITSHDGQSWTPRSVQVDPADQLYRVATSGNTFAVIPSSGNYVLSSPYGVSWAREPLVADLSLRGLLYADTFVVFTVNDTIFYSPNGDEWTTIQSNLTAPAMLDGAFSGRRVVIVKPASLLTIVSVASGMWSDASPAKSLMSSFDDIAWTGGIFVVAGQGESILSFSGTIWRKHATFPVSFTGKHHLACSDSLCVAIGGFGNLAMIWEKP
jgi:hypothetical protein